LIDAAGCEHIRRADAEIDRRRRQGKELVSANPVIPCRPVFRSWRLGQVLTRETTDFMCTLDVKKIHGYDASKGRKLVRAEALAARSGSTRRSKGKRPTNRTIDRTAAE
jgi:arginine decarboxylase